MKGIVTDIDRSKTDITFLPEGQSLISGEHWGNLKTSLCIKDDTDAMMEEKAKAAMKVTCAEIVKK